MQQNLEQHKRADELSVGDVVAIADMVGAPGQTEAVTCRVFVVHTLYLVGDDVEVNGWLTTSRNNLVTTVPAFKR